MGPGGIRKLHAQRSVSDTSRMQYGDIKCDFRYIKTPPCCTLAASHDKGLDRISGEDCQLTRHRADLPMSELERKVLPVRPPDISRNRPFSPYPRSVFDTCKASRQPDAPNACVHSQGVYP